MPSSNTPHVCCESRRQFRAWLARHHATHPPIWLVFPKKHARGAALSPDEHLTYDAIVEECLCFGWIDSLPGTVDATHTRIYLAPRKPRSIWSALNKRRVATLEVAGLIAPAGRAKIDAARRDGSWNTLDAVAETDRGKLPEDFARALAQSKPARQHFDAFPPGAKRQIVQWIVTAKRPQTRAERIATSVAMARLNQRAGSPGAPKAFLVASAPPRATKAKPAPRAT